MEAALPDRGWAGSPPGLGAFGNWILCWIFLPNAAFCLLWFVGGPPRGLEILGTALIGIAAHRAPFAFRYAAFAAALAYSVLAYVSGLFNLSIRSLFYSLQFAGELQPSASAEYLLAAGMIVLTFAAAWRLLKRPATLDRPARIVAAACLAFLAASADGRMANGHRGSYSRIAEAGAPFSSAVLQSGFAAGAAGRHKVLIMVEAMGQPSDPALRDRLTAIWARPEVRARYEVVTGDTLFYGSTTGGEMRELCGRWGDYYEVLDRKDPGCLPAALARSGYRSQAWHSFNGSFFERTAWYPNIGFGEMRFADRLRADGAGACPGIFAGACDRDVPRQLAATLRAADQPHFLYWLTVNSHLPVISDQRLRTSRCEGYDARLAVDYPMTCRLFSLFDQIAAPLAREITAADFPQAEILIVGDHIPPFFDSHHRRQFAPDRVPWILLRPKGKPPA